MQNITIKAAGMSILATFLIGAASPAAHATTYDAVTGFSKQRNPNGVWSYTAGSQPLAQRETQRGDGQVHYWYNGRAMPKTALVGRNFANKPYDNGNLVIYPTHLHMDPEQVSDVTIRFTAPIAGQYAFKGNFEGTDKAEAAHKVEVAVDGAVMFSGTIGSFGQRVTFGGRATLAKGDTIDFISRTNGAQANLSTGLKANIAGH